MSFKWSFAPVGLRSPGIVTSAKEDTLNPFRDLDIFLFNF
jgi:hypothetical protein